MVGVLRAGQAEAAADVGQAGVAVDLGAFQRGVSSAGQAETKGSGTFTAKMIANKRTRPLFCGES